MLTRTSAPPDRAAIADILASDDTFLPEDQAVALELVDSNLERRPEDDYRVLVAEERGRVLGYICYGPTPMTDGTFDLYWLATHRDARGKGVATALVGAMEEKLGTEGARLVRVETSTLESYGSAREFYVRRGYDEVARIRDFYRDGDDLITLIKKIA